MAESPAGADELPSGSVVSVVGLGYVGVPLALAFDEAGFEVVGYDVDERTVARLAGGEDVTGQCGDDAVSASTVEFTADPVHLERADYVVVAVPTDVDRNGAPDLDAVRAAGRTVGEHLSEGATVVLESTVYPGVTREVLGAAVAEASGEPVGEGFDLGHSPERLSPGDDDRRIRDLVKIVSGSDEAVLADLVALYGTIVDAGIHRAPSIEVAEAAKLVENAQRDLNIAFVNELAVVCEHMDLDTDAVLEAAGTKWNFHEYSPGLVGGHCIPVDPRYLAYGAERAGYRPELVLAGRAVNEHIPDHVAKMAVKALNDQGKVLGECRVLVLGLAYKPNVGDVRNSEVRGVIDGLAEFDVTVVGHDPHADDDEVREYFGVEIQSEPAPSGFDGIVLATPHDTYLPLALDELETQLASDPVLVDVYGAVDQGRAHEAGFDYRKL